MFESKKEKRLNLKKFERWSWLIPLATVSCFIFYLSCDLLEMDHGRLGVSFAGRLEWFCFFPAMILVGVGCFFGKDEFVFPVFITATLSSFFTFYLGGEEAKVISAFMARFFFVLGALIVTMSAVIYILRFKTPTWILLKFMLTSIVIFATPVLVSFYYLSGWTP